MAATTSHRMSRHHTHCRNCRRPKEEVGPISVRGLCYTCSYAFIAEAIHQLREKRGYIYERWRAGVLRSLSH